MLDSHGQISIRTEGPIIHVVARGGFNLDGCQRYIELVRPIIEAMGEQPFAMLIDNRELEGGTPEAYAELDRFNLWINARPLAAKARVVRLELLSRIMEQRLPATRQQILREFTDMAEARAWIDQALQQAQQGARATGR